MMGWTVARLENVGCILDSGPGSDGYDAPLRCEVSLASVAMVVISSNHFLLSGCEDQPKVIVLMTMMAIHFMSMNMAK